MNMRFFLIGVCMFLVVVGCGSSHRQEEGRRTLVVSIEPMRFLVESIAGDLFEVECMVPHGNSPETYEPLPDQLMSVAQSDAYFRVGPIGFEQTWMERLSASAPTMQVLDMSEGISFIQEEAAHAGHHHAGGREPHIWTSPRNVRLIAANVYQALCRLSPADSAGFRQRWSHLDSLLIDTDCRIQKLLADSRGESFLIYHPTLSYFARDYGLHQLCVEERGKEPSPSHLKRLIEEAGLQQVRVIFVQREFDTRHAEVVAKETGCRVVTIDPLSYDWVDEMLKVAQELAKKEETDGENH